MNEPSLKRLKYILDRNCLWLDLIESPPQDVHYSSNASLLFPVEMSFIVLKVKRKRTGYHKNRLIKISERQLDSTFSYCKQLVSVPKNLFDNQNNLKQVNSVFYNCAAITSEVPELWKKSGITTYYYAFTGCSNAANYADIPSTWK